MTPFAVRLAALAEQAPDAPAVTDAVRTLSRRELDLRSNAWARALVRHGVREGDIVSLCLPSDASMVIAAWAVWKAGATPQPLSARMVPHELREVIELTQPALLVGQAPEGVQVPTWSPADEDDDGPLPVRVSPSWKAPTSGGSSGRPKVILATSAAQTEPLLALAGLLRIEERDTSLVPAPLHHNGPFLVSALTVLSGGHVVVMPRFDPQGALDLITRHRATFVYSVPTIMSRMAKCPGAEAADLSSVHTMFHMAAPCPTWLKHWWIDKIGPEAVMELYTGTEVQAITMISGTEWLERPGSVGRTVLGQLCVLREDGSAAAAGEVGEVFLRSESGPTYRYLGATAKVRGDGWESLGDLGHLDADGYLYLGDRSADMVLVGGVNVYPAEIEAALDAHPSVVSNCVVGLPDEDLGNRLHAVVQLARDVEDADLLAFVSERLAPHKRPRSFSRSETPLRDDAGKVRRSAVRAALLEGAVA